MGDKYQIVGECAHVVVTDHTGVSAVNLLYKGAFLPDGVDKDRLQHLLDTGLVAEVKDGEEIAPNAAVAQDPAVGIPPLTAPADDTGDKGSGVPELTAEQQAARATLPADGSAPDGRAAHDVWVEYAVIQGLSREEAAKVSKDELRKALAGGK